MSSASTGAVTVPREMTSLRLSSAAAITHKNEYLATRALLLRRVRRGWGLDGDISWVIGNRHAIRSINTGSH